MVTKPAIEHAATKLLDLGVGIDGKGCVIIRSGALGAYVVSRETKGVWVDAFWKDPSKVVDVTGELDVRPFPVVRASAAQMRSSDNCGAGNLGAGNSFLGGLGAGLALSGGDVVQGSSIYCVLLLLWPSLMMNVQYPSDILCHDIVVFRHRTARPSPSDVLGHVHILRRNLER